MQLNPQPLPPPPPPPGSPPGPPSSGGGPPIPPSEPPPELQSRTHTPPLLFVQSNPLVADVITPPLTLSSQCPLQSPCGGPRSSEQHLVQFVFPETNLKFVYSQAAPGCIAGKSIHPVAVNGVLLATPPGSWPGAGLGCVM